MPRVEFTPNLRRHLDVPAVDVEAQTVREALDRVFADHPRLRGYIVDERGELRQHVVVFIDGQTVEDRRGLSDPLGPSSELFVMQALSGG